MATVHNTCTRDGERDEEGPELETLDWYQQFMEWYEEFEHAYGIHRTGEYVTNADGYTVKE